MAIQVVLNHKTSYRYDRLVTLGPQTVRLRPAPHCRTPVRSYSMKVDPPGHFCNWVQDSQSNYLARLVFPEKVKSLVVEVDLIADMTVINPFDFFLEPFAEQFPFAYPKELRHEIAPFLRYAKAAPRLTSYLQTIETGKQPVMDFLVSLNQKVQSDVGYIVRMEPGVQTCTETLEKATGSCRDSAFLLVQLLRHLGLASRFVSGYLVQLAPDVPSLDGPSGPTTDFTDLHAWAEVFLPGAGWVGLDPTSGLLAGEGHIPLACSPEPQGAAPISGDVERSDVDFRHEMSVKRLFEDPRVTKPYTDAEWAVINRLGRKIDSVLLKEDVRLTMGGEPTFVSIDDVDSEEWKTLAEGKGKRERGEHLIRRLKKAFASGALLHFGQGKWYPGEPIPRWSLACYWRRDGQPIWQDDNLLADNLVTGKATVSDAKKFITRLSELLRVNPENVIPGYEDTWYYLWKERRLPHNVDPHTSRLDDPVQRETLARVFDEGLGKPIGFALPIQRATKGRSRWLSSPWSFRTDVMFLIAGDSPMGFRLPLDSLPWLPKTQRPSITPEDPFTDRPPLDSIPDGSTVASQPSTDQDKTPTEPVRTALCVETRCGHVHVFMPPVEKLEHYLELTRTIENAASDLRTPIIVEGYAPPHDPRMREIKVTPDPGVLEVNTPYTETWDDLVQLTDTLYQEARHSRLGTEKFMVDGRHSGTGGGNHVVIGGPTPGDSPFLRRPHLLKSLIGYWHNHPSLSYLFSGLFVGPTSQAPRAEEARIDAAYELEIAFQQISNTGEVTPWHVDRVFRHLLVDVTGNTHRAEFCIDKLYSPDGPTGRLGLVELRAFEMPPHPRMSLTQQLLLRALIAYFWTKPWDGRLVTWGNVLYDRFALPAFVRHDFDDVVRDLNEAGYDVKGDWFVPHFEFRFPRLGVLAERGLTLELRQALEPWHVLGEESRASSTVRYVDSSVERVQVLLDGLTDDRYVLTCNERRVPLHPTGVDAQFVAGVRFRAWQPPSCLHPTIPVHAPLVFDIVDTWQGRSIAGCTYHVEHPGGSNYETLPVNANEAESRRAARFFTTGHTPGPLDPPLEHIPSRFPMTLDLRYEAP